MTSPPCYVIREFSPEDLDGVKICFEELQHFEKKIEPRRLDPAEMAQIYVQNLLEAKNQIFVAENKANGQKNEIVGFVAILTGQFLDAHLNEAVAMSYVNDLVVLPAFRQKGVAAELMRAAEEFALSKGSKYVQLNVLAKNEIACAAYSRLGYEPYEITLMKRLNIYL